MQRDAVFTGANVTVQIAGRGTGKGLGHAAVNLRNFQAMPGSTTAFVVPNAKRGLTNTLPSMFMWWESWGYKRDVHWCVGHRPPKKLEWKKPLIPPDNYDNIISFYTGAIGQIISQDRTGTSNSKSFDFVDIDEAKFVDFEQLKNETFQANRGQIREFGHCPWHHGMYITTDMPVTNKGSWPLRYEKMCDADFIKVLQGLVQEIGVVKYRLTTEKNPPDYLQRKLKDLRRFLSGLQKNATFYKVYSSLTNLEVLGVEFIKQQKRDLPALIFMTSILCIRPEISQDGFYSSMRPWHKYTAADFHYLDSLDYLSAPMAADCRADRDLQQDRPLCISFDFNANINWLVAAQPDEDQQRINIVKSFYVKYERKLPELVDDFCKYYEHFKTKEVIFYYDSTALGSNYAVNDQDFAWVICHRFEYHGWIVRPVYIGAPMPHLEKHLLINRAFAGQTDLMPHINEENNEYLLVSIQLAGVYNGKKDKRGEKLVETEEDKLEARTDGSDAFDTNIIGCLRFPQAVMVVNTGDPVV